MNRSARLATGGKPAQIIAGAGEVPGLVADALVTALHPSFWIAAAMALVGLGCCFRLQDVPLVKRCCRAAHCLKNRQEDSAAPGLQPPCAAMQHA